MSNPRPHAFPRIEVPQHLYKNFNETYCPLSFDYPQNAKINQKKFFFNENPDHECWFNLSIEQFDATLFFTYQPLTSQESLENLVDDAFTMVSKHNPKANSRSESKINNPYGLEGVLFEIGGSVASPLQFYLTDLESHFLRASLYYNQTSSNDSLQIVTDYIKTDVLEMIRTTKFN